VLAENGGWRCGNSAGGEENGVARKALGSYQQSMANVMQSYQWLSYWLMTYQSASINGPLCQCNQ